MAYCLLVISDLLQSSQVGFMDMLTGAAANTNMMTFLLLWKVANSMETAPARSDCGHGYSTFSQQP